eukprot:NODE_31801_length_389_cov_2.301527.p3 GENE.NODE_31801_length_389_cov_2.301527~~NODE_31801_length_389_cov_2.301527.p3  ORF type:complete len:72 (-),score=9.02 NODE_31801_length_389_cov_2.301527:4-219(-)
MRMDAHAKEGGTRGRFVGLGAAAGTRAREGECLVALVFVAAGKTSQVYCQVLCPFPELCGKKKKKKKSTLR